MARSYRRARRAEMPDIGEQLDVIWKQFNQWRLDGKAELIQQADDMLGQILAVKAKHPKPEPAAEEPAKPKPKRRRRTARKPAAGAGAKKGSAA